MGKLQRALGLMSGTSMDGIDVALLATDGNRELQHGPAAAFPYPSEIRLRLRNALGEAKSLVRREDRPGLLRDLERDLTLLNAEAVKRFLAANGIDRGTIDLVGYHGQTVLHDPARAMTVQLGDGALLASRRASTSCSTCARPMWPRAGRGRRWSRSTTAPLPCSSPCFRLPS